MNGDYQLEQSTETKKNEDTQLICAWSAMVTPPVKWVHVPVYVVDNS